MSIWLARKAGEAYDAGAFWDRFSELIGVNIPMHLREVFANRFRQACRKSMSAWLPPEDLGGQHIVGEFLLQAGLPLDRCQQFAQHFRKVERQVGLPDLDAPDAGDQLREAMLESLQGINVPTLKRALRGAAGARICEVALAVVLEGNYRGVNPRLGQELERVFEHAERGTLRRSVHQPFLRLGDDFSSLEIVCPRQDASVVGPGGPVWIVDGVRTPTPRAEELVEKVTDKARVSVEMAGQAGLQVPPRTFTLNLNDRTAPFILFDERSRRERRVSGAIPAGTYWLLHRSSDTLSSAEESYEWPAGERVLSSFRIRPGSPATLVSSQGTNWTFSSVASAFFEATGDNIAPTGVEAIWYRWVQSPAVWIPEEHANPELLSDWRVSVYGSEVNESWPLVRTTEETAGMVKCEISCGLFWENLSPALYRLKLTLARVGRTRVEASGEYWFWKGVKQFSPRGFDLVALPGNLVSAGCRGFRVHSAGIHHKHDRYREHTLTFDVGGSRETFKWSQAGIFLETVDRKVGERCVTESHRLGEAFSASLSSTKWVRLWFPGETDWEISVAGGIWHRAGRRDRREYVELSLASLALAYPMGGSIILRAGSREVIVAHFTSPLHALSSRLFDDGVSRGVRFYFAENIPSARATIWNLCTGQIYKSSGKDLDACSVQSAVGEGIPVIKCDSEEISSEAEGHRYCVTLQVPKLGWHGGLWLVDLEVRRDIGSEWEPVLVNGRGTSPILIRVPETAMSSRSGLLWESLAFVRQSQSLQPERVRPEELVDLLIDLMFLRKREYTPVAQQEMAWLKDSIRSLSQLAGQLARNPEFEALPNALLNLACQDPTHAGFVYLPGLLARPGSDYGEIPSGSPLNDALRRVGRLALAESVANLAREDFQFLDFSVLGCFRNFMSLASGTENHDLAEFMEFDFERYWESVIGVMSVPHVAPDWAGESLLGKGHTIWAIAEFARRYESTGETVHVSAANVLLHRADAFKQWLASRLENQCVLSRRAWNAPWLRVESPDVDFLESAPKFASLLALAARASASGLLDFGDVLSWIETQVTHRYMAEEGISALVSLGPELFGHQLLFWELMVRTSPHQEMK